MQKKEGHAMRTLIALVVLGVPIALFGTAAFAADDNRPDYRGPNQYAPPVVQTGPRNLGTIAGAGLAPTAWWQFVRDERGEGSRNR
jgi:hypothetical protein